MVWLGLMNTHGRRETKNENLCIALYVSWWSYMRVCTMKSKFICKMIPYTDGDEEVVQVMEFDERNLSWRDGLTLTEVGEIIEKQFRDWTIISIEECV